MVTHLLYAWAPLGFKRTNIVIYFVGFQLNNEQTCIDVFQHKTFSATTPGYTREQQGETNLIFHNDLQYNDSIYPYTKPTVICSSL